ncbi:hypothetical protein [Nesterenkonia sp. DZ6]|uniref:hypothetical protein n=1 Tax=Nesterenkonia sp. DZ6 TaxID=2901229 RepID=UPI001F4D147A|nr:hypothetical protein [Nesterenkonia sp. DZ6]MCH8560350.1 hypothetical protein [Nesterenkonia sp. DZ6]
MTTELKGKDTYFLPFNLGDNEHTGNPVNPKGSAPSYLWEQVLQRDSWLNIIGEFLHLEVSDKPNPVSGEREVRKTLLFHRYHQWDVVNQLIETARTEGLDVLQNYTSYKVTYRLAHDVREYDSEDSKVEKSEALKSLMS